MGLSITITLKFCTCRNVSSLASAKVWFKYHCFRGIDLAYLLKMLRSENSVPVGRTAFLKDMTKYLPNAYDLKYLADVENKMMGGLARIAERISVSISFPVGAFWCEHRCRWMSLLGPGIIKQHKNSNFNRKILWDDNVSMLTFIYPQKPI